MAMAASFDSLRELLVGPYRMGKRRVNPEYAAPDHPNHIQIRLPPSERVANKRREKALADHDDGVDEREWTRLGWRDRWRLLL
jgi:hypothetical protein